MKTLKNKYIINQLFDTSSLNYKNTENDIKMEDILQLFACNWFYYDFYKQQLISSNIANASLQEQEYDSYLSYFLNTVYQQDIDYVLNVIQRAIKHIATLDPTIRNNIILNFRCHLKNTETEYKMKDLKLMFTHFDSCGKTWKILFVISDSTYDDYFIPYLQTTQNKILTYNLNPMILGTLTETEKKVAYMMWNNNTNQKIAKELDCKATTIRFHINNIYAKLKIDNRFDLQKKMLIK